MEIYEPKCRGFHTIRYTLQYGKYKGIFCIETHSTYRTCELWEIWGCDVFDYLDNNSIIQSDCKLEYDEDCDFFKCILHDKSDNEFIIDDFSADEMKDCLVGIEIIDYQPECKEGDNNV